MACFTFHNGDDLSLVDRFLNQHRGQWVFGHISYGLSQCLHGFQSSKTDPIGFPLLHFFVPAVCFQKAGAGVKMIVQDQKHDMDYWIRLFSTKEVEGPKIHKPVEQLRPRLSKNEYCTIVDRLRGHILRGDCYEINFCQEFYAHGAIIDPVRVYLDLEALSPNPFSCFYKHEEAYLLCASPERFLAKRGNMLYSQPIKGTALRQPGDEKADEAAAHALQNSQKERSENVMVVDLVRNDLSRICQKGSVKVDELFGVYKYPQVHQMISTVSGALEPGVGMYEILKATFPMGSMTGAPKLKVMELIEKYEPTARGIFSGSVGYIAPDGDFDFNVVIRSIFHNQKSGYLGYQVGSGITWYSKAEDEYNECQWKALAIRKALGTG